MVWPYKGTQWQLSLQFCNHPATFHESNQDNLFLVCPSSYFYSDTVQYILFIYLFMNIYRSDFNAPSQSANNKVHFIACCLLTTKGSQESQEAHAGAESCKRSLTFSPAQSNFLITKIPKGALNTFISMVSWPSWGHWHHSLCWCGGETVPWYDHCLTTASPFC